MDHVDNYPMLQTTSANPASVDGELQLERILYLLHNLSTHLQMVEHHYGSLACRGSRIPIKQNQ